MPPSARQQSEVQYLRYLGILFTKFRTNLHEHNRRTKLRSARRASPQGKPTGQAGGGGDEEA